ncbi:porin [Trinickia sp.]|uniref:porin n=1 Tax=Trinickia sp. TaxID=2571163 RepID=UPI003F819C61
MKKITASLLSCLSLTSGVALAQSSVTLYGNIDLGIERTNNGKGTSYAVSQGVLVTNKWGLLGREDLGGGYSVLFQLESGFFPNTGTSDVAGSMFNRQSWVGVQSPFGTIKVGRIKTLLYQYDYEYLDASGNAMANASFRLFNFFGNRTSNTIEYSDAAHGFKWAVQHSLGGVAGNSRANSMWAESLAYNLGKAEFLIVNQKSYNDTGSDSTTATTFGGNYDFGVVRVYAAAALDGGPGPLKTREYSAGLAIPIGALGRFQTTFVHKQNISQDHANANLYGFGYVYALSKSTNLYTSWGRLTNGANASYNVTRPGATFSTFNAGIQHFF